MAICLLFGYATLLGHLRYYQWAWTVVCQIVTHTSKKGPAIQRLIVSTKVYVNAIPSIL